MAPNGSDQVSANVEKVISALIDNPTLVVELNQAFAKAYQRAGVALTDGEKAELFSYIAASIRSPRRVTGL